MTIQGEAIYRISDTEKIREIINFSIDSRSLTYLDEDQGKLSQRIVNSIKTVAKRDIEKRTLKETLRSGDELKKAITLAIRGDAYVESVGIEVTNVNILAISPSKETARALEAETREKILKEADDAIYERRNSSVEQERRIKENELNTEIAIENKKRQIREAQMDAEKAIKEKEHQLIADETAFMISQEKEKGQLVELEAKNKRTEADSRAYAMEAVLKTLDGMDSETLKVLSMSGMRADQLIASAFEVLAKNSSKIGELNISPDLLSRLVKDKS